MPNNTRAELAISGGKPVRENLLPYGRQTIEDDDIEAVSTVLKGDWLTTGPEVAAFEKEVAEYVGVKHAIALSNGTAALHAAYFAAGIQSGDQVVTSGMTFAATGNAALFLGAKPIFADIENSTGNIDPDSVKDKVNSKTKAIVGIDYYGHPCDAEELQAIADENRIKLIIDASHSLGAEYKGQKAGSLGDLSTLSFHPVKSITTGEGGMVLTNDEELYDRVLHFRTHGIYRDANTSKNGDWFHEMRFLGFNYRVTDFQCALGRKQLEKLPRFIERRREIASQYRLALSSMKSFSCPVEKSYCLSSYHLFPLLVNIKAGKDLRKFVFDALRAENIGVQVHYIPVYRHPYYREITGVVDCPRTDEFYEREISLPIFPSMTEQDVVDVICALQKIHQEILVKSSS